jgi:hypothetical protein
MLGLSKSRELRSQWQRAAELLLGEADVAAVSKAVELALFYDAKLNVAAMANGVMAAGGDGSALVNRGMGGPNIQVSGS